MALRPGSLLLISSHFIPLPRSSIIKASSSADHFDCFFAGNSIGRADCKRFVGIDDLAAGADVVGIVVVGDTPVEVVVLGAVRLVLFSSSSSREPRSSDISTLPVAILG